MDIQQNGKKKQQNVDFLIIKNTVDALKCLKEEKNLEMLDRLGVYSRVELGSRYEILLENYIKLFRLRVNSVKNGQISNLSSSL